MTTLQPIKPYGAIRFTGTPPPPKKIPSESDLRILLANGMLGAVENFLKQYPEELKLTIENGELVDLVVGAPLFLKKFVTNDPDTLVMKDDAIKLMDIDDEVLITGETGTGKELIANAMLGKRDGKFIAVNCAGLPDNLIESELFGHAAGAFTGANKSKRGMLSVADNGVCFLDEIGELPIGVQGKLLRALQSKTIRPVGENEERPINCRFVCATHRDLEKMVSENQFRQDLFARISTFRLHIKPLRDRKKDIEPILLAIGERLKIQSKTQEFISKYRDGLFDIDLSLNVRSLEQALKRYNILGKV
jgi:transcriptional regulator with PAS, ATPase and Fis domain